MAGAKDTVARMGNLIHRTVFTLSGGRLMGNFFGMPVVELITIGRKSGKKRPTMLTSPVQEGDSVVLVASYGGDPKHPTWFLNLRENPDVEILMKGRRRQMKARVASPEEKERLWPQVVGQYKGYGQYQTRTSRDIPLVILDPA